MGSPLGPSLANAFLAYHEQNGPDSCSLEYRPLYYQQNVEDILVVFKSSDHLIGFQSYFNCCHVNMKFTVATEQNNNSISVLHEIILVKRFSCSLSCNSILPYKF